MSWAGKVRVYLEARHPEYHAVQAFEMLSQLCFGQLLLAKTLLPLGENIAYTPE